MEDGKSKEKKVKDDYSSEGSLRLDKPLTVTERENLTLESYRTPFGNDKKLKKTIQRNSLKN
jgi:hypothetical protein